MHHSSVHVWYVAAAAVCVLAFSATTTNATIIISSGKTARMNCSGGVCTPTAPDAVLNAGDLDSMLASGNVTVRTAGSSVQADNIEVSAALSWSTSSTLSLDAYESIAVDAAVSVTALGNMSLTLNDGGKNGTLWFSQKGNIAFSNLSSQLSINGESFILAGDITTLANDIAADQGGNFALANSYDAKNDGTYSASPLPAIGGVFTGLGNTISNLSINDTTTSDAVGLFKAVYASGEMNGGAVVENLDLQNIVLVGPSGTSSSYSSIGAITGINNGVVFNDTASGQVTGGEYSQEGGLVGVSYSYEKTVASVVLASASASVSGGANSNAGGLVGGEASDGQVTGTISQSYATGSVTASGGSSGGSAGGLIAWTDANTSIEDSYATGAATGDSIAVGGFMGNRGSSSTVSNSYSTGVPSGSNSCIGGLIGYDSTSGGLKDTYWDTTTSGITTLSQGACNVANDPGITGLSNNQLKAKLPKGFSRKIWKESKKLDDGLPYLIANPPPKK